MTFAAWVIDFFGRLVWLGVIAVGLIIPCALIASLALLAMRRRPEPPPAQFHWHVDPPPAEAAPQPKPIVIAQATETTGRSTMIEQVQFLARIRNGHPSHDPLYPNPLDIAAETPSEQRDRHRRMQIGEFAPRRRHET